MALVGQLANRHAAGATFADYTSRKAPNAVKAQGFDLAVFAEYLAAAGVNTDADWLQSYPEAWQG